MSSKPSSPSPSQRFQFYPARDVAVLKESLAVNPYTSNGLSGWQTIAENLSKTDDAFIGIRPRTLRDRVQMLVKKFEAEDMAAVRRSGTEEEYGEREMLLTDLVHLTEQTMSRPRIENQTEQGRQMRDAAMRNCTTITGVRRAAEEEEIVNEEGQQQRQPPPPPHQKKKTIDRGRDELRALLESKRKAEEEEREMRKELLSLEKKRLEATEQFYANEDSRREREEKQREEDRKERMDMMRLMFEMIQKK